jgi:hypothetical protein
MATLQSEITEVSILNRILQPNTPTFSPEVAQEILAFDFDEADKEQMRLLSAKARAGTLTADEDALAGKYEIVGHLLNIMQSKARRSLKNHAGDSENLQPRRGDRQ